jgi:hypothetical protein
MFAIATPIQLRFAALRLERDSAEPHQRSRRSGSHPSKGGSCRYRRVTALDHPQLQARGHRSTILSG